jgi:hypothetical protein
VALAGPPESLNPIADFPGLQHTDCIVRSTKNPRSEPTDAEVGAILISAMAEVGADPALIYAFQRTGVYVCEENERRLSKQAMAAWHAAVDEYRKALARAPR